MFSSAFLYYRNSYNTTRELKGGVVHGAYCLVLSGDCGVREGVFSFLVITGSENRIGGRGRLTASHHHHHHHHRRPGNWCVMDIYVVFRVICLPNYKTAPTHVTVLEAPLM